ncbi:MAG: coenzyme F420-0:L-glutamate ligase [Tissierellia bacterium]|nr:coenzyme F420-0:L-glutamate ligase [Tissierellia bacterium]
MNRYIGTVVRGLRTPIVKNGDNLTDIVLDSFEKAISHHQIQPRDRDILCITESLLARSQGNFASTEDIRRDLLRKFDKEIGLVFPILSRNRFSSILKAVAQTGLKITILLSYPYDEVGNHLMEEDRLRESKLNPYQDILSEEDYRASFGDFRHPFTGINYVDLYKEIAPQAQIVFSNNARDILNYTQEVLVCAIHKRKDLKEALAEAGAKRVYGLDDVLSSPLDGSGYNEEYGLLGSNLSGENTLKLFPRDGQPFVENLQRELKKRTGKTIEVMIYGDGAFKDPVGKIWELADPVVSPAYTSGLAGRGNEIKIKYIADTELKHASEEEAHSAIVEKIKHKDPLSIEEDQSLGTTPRQITDLIGSLADLTSGSGDKGTPVVYIQGYFDNLASE